MSISVLFIRDLFDGSSVSQSDTTYESFDVPIVNRILDESMNKKSLMI